MYKKITISLFALLFISITANSQSNREAKVFQMSMFANVGAKTLDFKNLEKNDIILPKAAFNLGAGAYWSYKKILWSSDFYYSQSKAGELGNLAEYNAFTNSFYVSYKIIDKYKTTLAPFVGMAMTSNRVSVYDDNTTSSVLNNAYVLTHHDNAIRVGLNFEAIVYLKNSIGIVLGYDHSLNNEAE